MRRALDLVRPSLSLYLPLSSSSSLGVDFVYIEIALRYIYISNLKLIEGLDESLAMILTHGNYHQFFVTFSFSVFSASYGLSKCLKNGVAGTFKPGGVLDGLCSVQFILAFLGRFKIGILKF